MWERERVGGRKFIVQVCIVGIVPSRLLLVEIFCLPTLRWMYREEGKEEEEGEGGWLHRETVSMH